ncbi:MAG TPA: hypothetical protein VJA94_24870 [Candidatus Angelobacter sp.]
MAEHKPNSTFLSAWWSADLPNGWQGHQEPECATISREPRLGVLQVSAVKKPDGMVTDDDLRDFAEDHVVAGRALLPVEYKVFSGFALSYLKGSLFWKEWWLRSGDMIVYATYNVQKDREHIEADDLETILSSLKPSHP